MAFDVPLSGNVILLTVGILLALAVVFFTVSTGGLLLGLLVVALIVLVLWVIWKRTGRWAVHSKAPRPWRRGGDG